MRGCFRPRVQTTGGSALFDDAEADALTDVVTRRTFLAGPHHLPVKHRALQTSAGSVFFASFIRYRRHLAPLDRDRIMRGLASNRQRSTCAHAK